LGKSVDEILEEGALSVWLKAPNIEVLGVMLDADADPKARYRRFRQLCEGLFPGIPDDLPSAGLIHDRNDGKRIGFWIMPDNSSSGTLETFLKHLVPKEATPLWDHAVQVVNDARTINAPVREIHVEKANLYTWLAWQDPPGQSPGIALTKRCLDPHSPSAKAFEAWFRELYSLTPKAGS
jgi:hypothetical protein